MKKQKVYRLDTELISKIDILAKQENRKPSNYVETALTAHVKKQELPKAHRAKQEYSDLEPVEVKNPVIHTFILGQDKNDAE